MAGSRRIVIEFLGKDVSAGKTADQVEGRFSRLGSRFQRVGDAAGKILAGGLLAGGAAMVKFGNQASDLAETQSKINQIFGKDGARNLDNFAAAAAKNLGQSKQQALDAAATFGIFGKAAGKTGVDLVNFSTQMTVLASDMASFNNTSPEQAIEAIGAALRGESEPIRAYGVMLNDAALKAEALSMGLLKPVKESSKINSAQATLLNAQKKYNDAVKEHGKNSLEAVTAQAHLGAAQTALKKATDGTIPPLTQQQKALATQSLILKQTKDQQGDFARTSNGLANKQRILKAEFQNLTTQLGTKALPIMLKVTDWGMKAIGWMEKHQKLVKGIAGVILPLVAGLYLLAKAQAAVNLVMTANPIGLVIVAIAALAAGLIYAYKKSKTFREIVNGAFKAVGDAGKFMWEKVLKPTFKFLIDTWLNVAGWIIKGAAKAFGWVPGIGPKLRKAADWFDEFKTKVNRQINGIKDPKIKVSTPGADHAIGQLATIKQLIHDIKSAGHVKPPPKTLTQMFPTGGRKATGGNIQANRVYSWNENGREMFMSNRGGSMLTAQQARGRSGGTVTHVLDLRLNGKTIRKMLLEEQRSVGHSIGIS